MKRITALRAGKSRGKQVDVFMEDRFAFSLGTEVVVMEGLRIGQELSPDRINTLIGLNTYNRCFAAASRYLGYRPRSESELKEKLRRRGFDDESVETVTTKLKRLGLLDDVAFANFWKAHREEFSPRSQRLTKLELRRSGIDEKIVDQVVGTIDEDDSAYRAAQNWARRSLPSDYHTFNLRLGGYLRRRGFNYEVIKRTTKRLWQERKEKPDNISSCCGED